jgi:hypothetical protein
MIVGALMSLSLWLCGCAISDERWNAAMDAMRGATNIVPPDPGYYQRPPWMPVPVTIEPARPAARYAPARRCTQHC